MRIAGLITVALLGLAYLVLFTKSDNDGQCRQLDARTLEINGRINAALADCVDVLLGSEIDTVIVTSQGGETFAGRRIGNRIGDRPRTLVVRDRCLSSCGNYFVPAAQRLVLEPGAVVGLHGTPDPATMARHMRHFEASLDRDVAAGEISRDARDRSLSGQVERDAAQLDEEAAFAERFGVPKGWRLYRGVGDGRTGFLQYFNGRNEALDGRWDLLVVEAPMLQSCLPHVLAEGYQQAADTPRWRLPQLWLHPIFAFPVRSGELRCTDPEVIDPA
ncbi:hypothetical protein [uncultured Maricaulis sp.]|uniref:hypothetical protein n=1 Tax=uncultured Maricaulis sp. TaxID=174710 RepID=UPI0030D9900D|tara:strand:+ start:106880 stop:107704 length:825 start_codon:yes stop_codon:yes gene_type:complete